MSQDAAFAWLRRLSPRQRVLGYLAIGLALLLLLPYGFALSYFGVTLALAAAVPAYLLHGRWSEAAWVALPVLAANLIEHQVGAELLVCLALPWLALTRRPRFSILLGSAVMAALVIGIQLKARFGGTRMTWNDVRFFFVQFRDNLGVVASQPTVALYAVAAIAALTAIVYAGWVLDRRGLKAGAPPVPVWAPPVLAVALVLWCGVQVVEGSEQARKRGVWVMGEVGGGSASLLSQFFATAAMQAEWMPGPVDTARFREEVRKRMGGAGAADKLPDVLLFMQESQINTMAFEGCPREACALPVFEATADTRAMGPLRVHTFGSGTWLSEFTTASGVPHTVFGAAGDFAPFNVSPAIRRSFVRSMRDAGYRTIAIYPVRGGMMNARQAYRNYGFDRFYDSEQLGLSGSFDTTDDDMHRAALHVLDAERRHGRPVLMFVITIFNHGEHGVRMERVPPTLVERIRVHFPDGREAENLADYLWRTGEFQRVMRDTRHAVLQGPRPAVLAWYGDHQPPFGRAMGLRKRVREQVPGVPAGFTTWYEIGSNLPRGIARDTPPALDIAFLPGLLAQAAGVPLDDWLAANVAARELCGGLLVECRQPEVRHAYLWYLYQDLKAFALP